ncbi:MAG TPA: MlaD family protein [Acidobacteriota bacterium]|nr:MlaD family protein [Acidobacteriota bacterium]
MSFSENKGLWLMVVFMAVVAAVLVWVILSAQPLRLVVLYERIGGLKHDDPLMLQGITIGKVEDIKPMVDNQIGVSVRIREDYASKLTEGTNFILREASFFGLVGKNAIEVVPPPTPGRQFSRGEKVQGQIPSQPSLIEQGKKWSQEYWIQLKSDTSQLIDVLRTSPYRYEAEAALDQLRTLADEGARVAREGMEDFRRSHQKDLDEILKKLEQLRDEMRRKGDVPGASRIEKEIQRARGNPQQ